MENCKTGLGSVSLSLSPVSSMSYCAYSSTDFHVSMSFTFNRGLKIKNDTDILPGARYLVEQM